MSEPLTDRMYVSAYQVGIGARKYASKGDIICQRIKSGNEEMIEISVGRGHSHVYGGAPLVNAWAKLTPAKAHELAMLLTHLTHQDCLCVGEGVKASGKHDYSLKVDLEFTADLCTVLNKPKELREMILKEVNKKLDEIQIPKGESNVS